MEIVNLKDNFGWRPLHWAVMRNYKDIAILLIESGADVNAENDGKATPLHCTAQSSNAELTLLLIENGAQVNVYL